MLDCHRAWLKLNLYIDWEILPDKPGVRVRHAWRLLLFARLYHKQSSKCFRIVFRQICIFRLLLTTLPSSNESHCYTTPCWCFAFFVLVRSRSLVSTDKLRSCWPQAASPHFHRGLFSRMRGWQHNFFFGPDPVCQDFKMSDVSEEWSSGVADCELQVLRLLSVGYPSWSPVVQVGPRLSKFSSQIWQEKGSDWPSPENREVGPETGTCNTCHSCREALKIWGPQFRATILVNVDDGITYSKRFFWGGQEFWTTAVHMLNIKCPVCIVFCRVRNLPGWRTRQQWQCRGMLDCLVFDKHGWICDQDKAGWVQYNSSVHSVPCSSLPQRVCVKLKLSNEDQAQLPQLPYWTNADETPDHVDWDSGKNMKKHHFRSGLDVMTYLWSESPLDEDTILEFHVFPCADFQRGFCAKHGIRGKVRLMITVTGNLSDLWEERNRSRIGTYL